MGSCEESCSRDSRKQRPRGSGRREMRISRRRMGGWGSPPQNEAAVVGSRVPPRPFGGHMRALSPGWLPHRPLIAIGCVPFRKAGPASERQGWYRITDTCTHWPAFGGADCATPALFPHGSSSLTSSRTVVHVFDHHRLVDPPVAVQRPGRRPAWLRIPLEGSRNRQESPE